jgi:CRP-like cAMP-binding protein
VRFRFERSWRVEAAALIGALPGFHGLAPEAIEDLAHRVRLRPLDPGAPAFRRGDRPTAFYVVRSGVVAVEDEDPTTGDVIVLRRLGRGASFGELGLLDMAPRSATVRATEEVQLFEVDKSAFDRLLADSIEAPTFAPSMQTLAELQSLPTFRGLPTDRLQEVLAHGAWLTFEAGDPIVRQGEPGDAFYVIARGQAAVTIDGDHVRVLAQGASFGELALLNDTPRTASVTAVSAMRVFRLDRVGFDAVVACQFDRTKPNLEYRQPFPAREG